MALVEDTGAGAAADDPEALLNEWLGELTVLTAVCLFIIINIKHYDMLKHHASFIRLSMDIHQTKYISKRLVKNYNVHKRT